jgi:lipoprotein-anchoring transpeptidase ErfK/SrfK
MIRSFAAGAGGAMVVAMLSACAATSTPHGSRTSAAPAPRPTPSRHVAAHTAPLPEQPVQQPVHKHRTNHCAHNRAAQKVIVSIKAQHLWMCARHRLVRQTPVTTGMVGQWTNTPTGNYRIQGRNRDTTLTLNTGATYAVKYWIPFDAPLFGFHDSSWQKFPYGSPKYKTDGSHGCVHMPLKSIAFLYRWVARPTAVHIS